MDTKQPNALRLADALGRAPKWQQLQAAAELRRLHAENETLCTGYDAARLEVASLQAEVAKYRESMTAGGYVGCVVWAGDAKVARHLSKTQVSEWRSPVIALQVLTDVCASELARFLAKPGGSAEPLRKTNAAARGTDAQIIKERELCAHAFAGAIADGLSGGAGPDTQNAEWLRPAFEAGKEIAQLRAEIELLRKRQCLHQIVEPKQAHTVPAEITLDFKMTTELLEMFGGEPAEITLQIGNGHSGKGVYAYYTDCPEEGADFLGVPDYEAMPSPLATKDVPESTNGPARKPLRCSCHTCWPIAADDPASTFMRLCPACGNKRCPKANDHRHACTGSNEPGQPGSAYQLTGGITSAQKGDAPK